MARRASLSRSRTRPRLLYSWRDGWPRLGRATSSMSQVMSTSLMLLTVWQDCTYLSGSRAVIKSSSMFILSFHTFSTVLFRCGIMLRLVMNCQ